MLRVTSSLITKRAIHHSIPKPQIRTEPIKQVFVKPIQQSYARPVLFGTAISTSIFCTAALIHEREKETFWQRLKNRADSPNWSKLRDIVTDDTLVLKDLWKEKKKMWLEKKGAALEEMKKRLDQYNSIPIEIKRVFLTGAQTYLSMSDADKTMAGLILINLAVFGAWKIPTLQPWMIKYFTHNPSSGRSITLLTSCFSHKNLLHLTMNMVGLWSFGPLIYDALGWEQFVAMYLSMGISANVCSHLLQLSLQSSRPIMPTLGASGALYGLLTGTALLYPNSSVFLVFLPMIPIRIAYAVPVLMSVDVVGIMMRWRMYDHFAHLSGAALGLAYMKYGPSYLWPNLLQTVRDIKKKGSSGGGGDDTSGVLMEMPKRLKWKGFGKKLPVPEE